MIYFAGSLITPPKPHLQYLKDVGITLIRITEVFVFVLHIRITEIQKLQNIRITEIRITEIHITSINFYYYNNFNESVPSCIYRLIHKY